MHLNNKLRTFNNLFTLVVMSLSIYIILTPFLPFFGLWYAQISDNTGGYRYQSQLAADSGATNISQNLAPIPEDNTLVVPQIQVDASVNEGADISALALDGVWRRPQTSTPDQGGNTVIVAHRFSYGDPATFYHLDRLAVGDRVGLFWNQQEFIYEIDDIFIVDPSQIEVEANTEEPILTLYTCTPVWTAAQRLIVTARLVNDPTMNLLPDDVNEFIVGGPNRDVDHVVESGVGVGHQANWLSTINGGIL